MKEINFFFFFYEHCRQNHLLFHALEKGTDSDTLVDLLPPAASLQAPPVSLVCTDGWRIIANEGATIDFLRARKKENAVISVLPQAVGDKAASVCHSLLTRPWVSHCTQVPLCHAETKALFYLARMLWGRYYGNTAAWLERGALRPYSPRLHFTYLCLWDLTFSMCPAVKGSAV